MEFHGRTRIFLILILVYRVALALSSCELTINLNQVHPSLLASEMIDKVKG